MIKGILAVLLLVPTLALAQTPPDPAENKNAVDWGALGFGLGIGVEHYRSPYLEEASTSGTTRKVNIDKQYDSNPSAWLTMSWNFIGKKPASGLVGIKSNVDTTETAFGLFAGIKLVGGGDNKAFNAFSIGPQVTFKALDRNISLGAGWVTHKTRGFAIDITEGKPLPADYTDVKFRERTESSWMIMLSVNLK